MDWLKKARLATSCNMQRATTLHHATRIATPCNMQRGSLHNATCNADRYTMQHAMRIAAPLCNAQRATYHCAQSRLAALSRCRRPTGQSSPPRQRWACTARSPRAALSPGADVAVPSRSPGADVAVPSRSPSADVAVPSRSPSADVAVPSPSPSADVAAASRLGCTLQDLQGPREGVAQCAVGVLATGAVPLPHLHRDWAHRCHICTGTGLTAATSARALGSPLPHLQCGWARPLPHLHGDGPRSRSCAINR
jgi:hypothetical protein